MYQTDYYLTSYCQENKRVGRVALTNDIVYLSRGFVGVEKNLIKLTPTSNFRSSGTWSIFSKSLFFELMKPNISPWDFEGVVKQDKKTSKRSVVKHHLLEDWDIIGLSKDQPLRTCCAIRTTNGVSAETALKSSLNLKPINEPRYNTRNCGVAKELREIGYIDARNRLVQEKNNVTTWRN